MQTRKELARIAAATEALAPGGPTRNTGHHDPRERMPLWARVTLAFGAGSAKENRARRILREYSIVACVGANGGGKTLAMMVMTSPSRDGVVWRCENPDHAHTAAGITSGLRRMLSTVPILDGHGKPHPLYDPFEDFQQLVEVEHCDVYMDEVTTVASSRESQRMDARVLAKLQQLRKADVFLYWTAPDWSRADIAIRQVTKCVIECRGYAPAPAPAEDDGALLWRPRRVFKFSLYDSVEFTNWTANSANKADPLTVVWFKGPGSAAFRAYDTLGSVTMIASMTPEDTCTVCEGRITRHTCKGHGRDRGAPALDIPAHAAL